MITSESGLGDKSFNDMMDEGMEKAKADLGVEYVVIQPRAISEFQSTLARAAGQGFDLIIGSSFDMIKPMKAVASRLPEPKVRPRRRRARSDRPQCRQHRDQGLGRLVPGRRHRGQDHQDRHHRLCRRQGHPDHPPLLHRLLLRGQDGRPRCQRARELFGHLHRSGGRQGIYARPGQPEVRHQLRGCGATSAGVIDAAKSSQDLRDRRRLQPELHGARLRADLDGEARRHPGLRHDQGGLGRHLQGRHR